MKLQIHSVVMCFFSLISITSHAQQANPSWRDQALVESQLDEKQKQKQTVDGRVEGMLSLEDPRLDINNRYVDYFFQLTMQNFQAQGRVESDLISQTFDLQQNSATVLPAIKFGIAGKTLEGTTWRGRLGLAAKFAYASQPSSVVFSSGYAEEDVRLNTLILAAQPFLSLGWQRLSWLHWNLGWEYGDINYTQTSSNDLATFSKHRSFQGWMTGFDFNLNKQLSLTTEYTRRQTLGGNNALQIQQDNFEVGARVLW